MSFQNRVQYAEDSMALNRPVRRPGATEYDLAVAKDLCRRAWGVQWEKAKLLPHLPLFFVAVDGLAGMELAERAARERMVA